MSFKDSPADWEEDFSHENGNYECRCRNCDRKFTGYKRRTQCKVCADHAAAMEENEHDVQVWVDRANSESERANGLSDQLAAMEGLVAKLATAEQEVVAAKEHLAERDEEIAELEIAVGRANAEIGDRQRELGGFARRIAERDKRIAKLEKCAEALRDLHGLVARPIDKHRSYFASTDEEEIAAYDISVAATRALSDLDALEEKDKRYIEVQDANAEGARVVADRDERIAELEAECSGRILSNLELLAKLAERGAEIEELEAEADFSTKVTNDQAALIEAQVQRIAKLEKCAEVLRGRQAATEERCWGQSDAPLKRRDYLAAKQALSDLDALGKEERRPSGGDNAH